MIGPLVWQNHAHRIPPQLKKDIRIPRYSHTIVPTQTDVASPAQKVTALLHKNKATPDEKYWRPQQRQAAWERFPCCFQQGPGGVVAKVLFSDWQ